MGHTDQTQTRIIAVPFMYIVVVLVERTLQTNSLVVWAWGHHTNKCCNMSPNIRRSFYQLHMRAWKTTIDLPFTCLSVSVSCLYKCLLSEDPIGKISVELLALGDI